MRHFEVANGEVRPAQGRGDSREPVARIRFVEHKVASQHYRQEGIGHRVTVWRLAPLLERLPDIDREQAPYGVGRSGVVTAAAVSARGNVHVRRRFVEQVAHLEAESQALV